MKDEEKRAFTSKTTVYLLWKFANAFEQNWTKWRWVERADNDLSFVLDFLVDIEVTKLFIITVTNHDPLIL